MAQALDQIPLIAAEVQGGGSIYEEAAKVERLPTFGDAVDALATPASVEEALSELTRTMAREYLRNRESRPVVFVHGVTAPAALRLLLPYLPVASHRPAFAYVWQVCAALRATCYAPERLVTTGEEAADVETIVDQAVRTAGAHGIKLTEACLREDRSSPDPAYGKAASDASRRLAV